MTIPRPSAPPTARLLGWTAVLVFAATWLTFFGAHRGEFLEWDDDINITSNTHIRGLSGENLRWMFTNTDYMRRYVPLGWLGWAVQAQVLGQDAAGYHLGNVLLHAVNAVLVLLLLRRLLLAAGITDGPAAIASAGLAAVFWAVHPLRVEPVAWASGRLYCQAALLLLVALLAYLRHAEARAAGRSGGGWYAAALLAYGGSLLTYPVGLALVAVLPVLDVYPLRRYTLDLAGLKTAAARRALAEKIPFLLVALLVLVATVAARQAASGTWRPPPTLAEFGLPQRAMQGFYVWAIYLWRTMLPLDLFPVYPQLVRFSPLDAPFVASLAAVVGLSAGLWWARLRRPALWAAWAAYLILLVPLLGFTEHPHFASDRYSYLPAIALAAVLAGVLATAWPRVAVRRLALPIAGAATAACAFASVRQVDVWHDTDRLFLHMIAKLGDDPYRADIYKRLGIRRLLQQRNPEAEEFFNAAIRVEPRLADPYLGLGEALIEQQRLAEAEGAFARALAVRPGDADLRVRLADRLTSISRYEGALRFYRAALETKPDHPRALNGLAWLLATCSDERRRDGLEALKLAERLSALTGQRSAMAEATLAMACRQAGLPDRAKEAAERAVSLAQATRDAGQIAHCAQVRDQVGR